MPDPVSEKNVEKPPSLWVLEFSEGRPSGCGGERVSMTGWRRKSTRFVAYVQAMLKRVQFPYRRRVGK